MNDLPRISLVVPSLNQGRYLRTALQSLFEQQYPRLEVVVMDGGSTDESVEIIRSFEEHISYWRSAPDFGQAAAINEGVRHCTGELIGWLNTDDFLCKRALWVVARAYQEFPHHGLYVGNGFRYEEKTGRYRPFSRRHVVVNRKALARGLDYLLQPAVFIGRCAWNEVGGLNPAFHYGLDWDLFMRIADRFPATLVNEFLAVSREHEGSKTSRGQLARVAELFEIAKLHTGCDLTPGSFFYALEALLGLSQKGLPSEMTHYLKRGMRATGALLAQETGHADGFPFEGDPQDRVYLPVAGKVSATYRDARVLSNWPSMSIVVPSLNQAAFLGQALDSILAQSYPNLQIVVIDGGSNDGSVDIIHKYTSQLAYWVSEPDRGPAHAINKGLTVAAGEIIGWLNSDDMFAEDALCEVAEAFSQDPELDLVYGNALYIDESNKPFLADHHGLYKTALYYGETEPLDLVPFYWRYIHSIPQPTVFFRRRLLESCGPLDESFKYVFDFELFWRFRHTAKIKKLERTQAFYRIHASGKTSDWNKFLIELYRFSRPHWPKFPNPRLALVLYSFATTYAKRRHPPPSKKLWRVAATFVAAFLAASRLANPEAVSLQSFHRRKNVASTCQTKSAPSRVNPWPTAAKREALSIDRSNLRYTSAFCSFHWPRHPGHSGGEIRDFHLVRHLLSLSRVHFLALYTIKQDRRFDGLVPHLDSLYYPQSDLPIDRSLGERIVRSVLGVGWSVLIKLQRFPFPALRYHNDALVNLPAAISCSRATLQQLLDEHQPDFFFVSPQLNPVAITLKKKPGKTRWILATYDVEALRVERLSEHTAWGSPLTKRVQSNRAARFEKSNMQLFDGVIAVSELDKNIFVQRYDWEPERILTVDNGVDTAYFTYTDRNRGDRPIVLFVGSLTYLPNEHAARRLAERVMPLVRRQCPEACVWIVRKGPSDALLALNEGEHTVITGEVPDVRPYLEQATVSCIPLAFGSGTKYKILEAMSAGVPVVATTVAAEGLEIESGRHFLEGNSDEQLAIGVVRVLQSAMLGQQLAHAARHLIERRYAWDLNLSRLDAWLEQLLALTHRQTY